MSGFYIKKLSLFGKKNNSDKVSSIKFKKGLNIIYGGSNNGKTFIYQCIDYVLGGDKKPKNIKEAKEYSVCRLDIQTYDGREYTIFRELDGKNFWLQGETKRYNPKSIRNLLLSITNMKRKMIRIDNFGKVKELEFERLKKYFMVNEDDILTKKSNIMGKTIKDKNSFKFLIKQKDDSYIEEIKPSSYFSSKEKEIRILEKYIKDIEKKIEDIRENGLNSSFGLTLENSLDKIKSEIDKREKLLKNLEKLKLLDRLQEEKFCPCCKQPLGNVNLEETAHNLNIREVKVPDNKEDNKKLDLKKELDDLVLEKRNIEYKLLKIDVLNDEKNTKKEQIENIKFEISKNREKEKSIKFDNLNSLDLMTVVDLMAHILKEIKFDDFKSIKFLEDELDFAINGESRKLYGQGYRAIIYVAFLVAILKYLRKQDFEIGFILIDSPFNAYEVKKNREDLAYNFFKYLRDDVDIRQRQVIFLENTKPHKDFSDYARSLEDGFLIF